MPAILRVTPVNVQVRHRGTFFPPEYKIVTTETATALAGKLAEVFNLKSSSIIFNQNTMSTQYLSFRYVLPNDPIRYLDTMIGLDQAEISFVNPATMPELKEEYLKVWKTIIETTKVTIAESYFEANLHATSEGTAARDFLDKFVNIQQNVARSNVADIQKGFSITMRNPDILGEARMGLELSTSIPNGLYVSFICLSKRKVKDVASLQEVFEKSINIYRTLQRLTDLEIVEPV